MYLLEAKWVITRDMIQPLSYEEIIQIADEQLENYVLDERIKEKYALE